MNSQTNRSKKSNDLNMDQTKNTNLKSSINQKSQLSMSDMNKFFRREQTYKKKLKNLIQTNLLAQTKIKILQTSIKDQRSTLIFQLSQLSKTMNNKISAYIDQKLDKDKFINNDIAQQTIKQMINKFQEVQKQTKVNKRVYQNLKSIYQHYIAYSEEIQKIVQMTQKSNKQYEDSMRNMLQEKLTQIRAKKQENQDLFDETQINIKKIDQFQQGKAKLITEQSNLIINYQNLLKIQAQKQEQLQKFNQWAKIVIDKKHRKVFNKQNKQKQHQLSKFLSKNNNLQVYLKQLKLQQQKLKKQFIEKQNQQSINLKKMKNKKSKSKNKNKKQLFAQVKK